ncbi:MAG: tetratricopeptide repeat protein, partial [Caulobacteraceae bacterium]
AGQAAVNAGHGAAAAGYFDRAAELNAGSNRGADASLLASRAFSASLLGGDIRRATALATIAAAQPAADTGVAGLAMLTRGVEALADGEPGRARALLSGGSASGDRLAPAALLAPIAAAAAGDAKGAAIHPVIADDPISQFYASLDQARLYEHFRRYEEAETAYRALVASGDPGGLASYNLGLFLERRGRAPAASGVYDRALSRNPDDRALVAALARLASARRPPPLISLRRMAAESLAAPAALLMVQKQEEAALAYLRLALRLDPADDDAWALVGDVLADLGDVDSARAAWLTPRPGSDSFAAARAKLAWSYQNAGATGEALKIAHATLAAAPGSLDSATNLADLLRASQRYDESIRVLDPLIAGEAGRPDWRLLYMRAVDYQESGRWADAERDLSRALALRPDEPELLNFLGYSWIDRGERLPQALDMIKKAVSLEPRSGAMLDSLGWGYYRLGDYPMAVRQLESAVALEAGDPDINDHLGDAYWRVGRVTEARYQWRRVLTLEPSAKLRGQAEAKLKSGLDGAAPAVVAGP